MQMWKHPRKLLKIAILGSIVPLSGAQAPASAEPVRSECPYARAAAAAQLEAQSGTDVRLTETSSASVSIFDVSRSAPGLVP
jgi:hypothetical protein